MADAGASADYFRTRGLQIGDRTVNHGPEQQRLDDVPDAVVDVVPVNPPEVPPHLELLVYRMHARREGMSIEPHEIAAKRTVWRCHASALICDLDGHLHQVETPKPSP